MQYDKNKTGQSRETSKTHLRDISEVKYIFDTLFIV